MWAAGEQTVEVGRILAGTRKLAGRVESFIAALSPWVSYSAIRQSSFHTVYVRVILHFTAAFVF